MTDSANSDRPSRQSQTILLATDSKNSVLVEVAGGRFNSIAYSVYGEQAGRQEINGRLGFNGELREVLLGWYLLGNGYRAYNPVLMRFHSPDSWSPFGAGGLNAYMYCVDPLNFSDPTGHLPKLIHQIGNFLSGVDRFLFGGASVTGPSRSKALKATRQVETVTGPMRVEKESTLNAFGTLGTVIAGAPGPRNFPPSPGLGDYGPTTERIHPGYVGGAAMDGLTALGSRSTTGRTVQSSSLSTGQFAPPQPSNSGGDTWTSSRGTHGREVVFPRTRGGGDATGMNSRLLPLQAPARQPFLNPQVQLQQDALRAAMDVLNARRIRAGQPPRPFLIAPRR
ncbi:RHS repeat-associated core domain-containing protein [Pseudomonas sp. NPDC087626]|uniref:RHS repeat-associated core domain-containing protein n=1 Tax=Pseudomonas sp. NPDC087626 TaxID=3364444 RepID=UPI0037F3EFA6